MGSCRNPMKTKAAAKPILCEGGDGLDTKLVRELRRTEPDPEFAFKSVPIPQRNQNIFNQTFLSVWARYIILAAIDPIIRCPVGDAPLDIEIY